MRSKYFQFFFLIFLCTGVCVSQEFIKQKFTDGSNIGLYVYNFLDDATYGDTDANGLWHHVSRECPLVVLDDLPSNVTSFDTIKTWDTVFYAEGADLRISIVFKRAKHVRGSPELEECIIHQTNVVIKRSAFDSLGSHPANIIALAILGVIVAICLFVIFWYCRLKAWCKGNRENYIAV